MCHVQFLILLATPLVLANEVTTSKLQWKIVGGNSVPIEDYPFMVSLQVNIFGKLFHICGGTIIYPQWILSAAHCADAVTSAVAGNSKKNSRGGQIRQITKKIKHPYYLEKPLQADIMLIKVDRAFRFSSSVQAANLGNINLHEKAAVIGWGIMSNREDPTRIRNLQELNVTTIECNGGPRENRIKICTISPPGEDSCDGDSGGPLVQLSSKSVVGLVSAGSEECAVGEPAEYTKIAAYKTWINQMLKVYW